jgi:hypothetical protein
MQSTKNQEENDAKELALRAADGHQERIEKMQLEHNK